MKAKQRVFKNLEEEINFVRTATDTELVEQYYKMALYVAKKYSFNRETLEDLLQEALIALLYKTKVSYDYVHSFTHRAFNVMRGVCRRRNIQLQEKDVSTSQFVRGTEITIEDTLKNKEESFVDKFIRNEEVRLKWEWIKARVPDSVYHLFWNIECEGFTFKTYAKKFGKTRQNWFSIYYYWENRLKNKILS
jgi:RNA polymerase sigma factor (sigma-70 family)